jgi:hypothetical protein
MWQMQSRNAATAEVAQKKRLIITTGDTSDVDGFLALAEYSKVQMCTLDTRKVIMLVHL